jgi:NAD(P)-dependent dehydrogenase (short-subunit alcohol dehydrogenase family)
LPRRLSPFGVKVCALEPGGMRTNWGARANQDTPELLPDYEPSVGAVAKVLKSYWGKEISDPAKVAQVVLCLASSDRLPAHLLIGSDAVRCAAEAEKTRAAEGAQWRDVILSTDVASATALPAMRASEGF